MNNKGNILLATPFVWVITICIFMFFLVMSVKILEPFLIYQKISETALKYIFVMEDFGCLNKSEQNLLKEELINKGLDINNIIINATDEVVEYGDLVELNILYRHPYKKSVFNLGFLPEYKEEYMDITVLKKGVSKR